MTNYRDEVNIAFQQKLPKLRMEVKRDEGLYRHLSFRWDKSFGWFEIITWPGCLTIYGDYGTYVFSRLPDMFEFFHPCPGDGINPHYWAQKVRAEDRFSGTERFCFDTARANFMNCIEDWPQPVQDMAVEIIDDLEHGGSSDGSDFYKAVFELDIEHEGRDYGIQDFHEFDNTQFTYAFLFSLHCIVGGIEMYKASLANKADTK